MSAPAGLQAGGIRVFDNKQPQAVVYFRSNQRNPEDPRAMVVVFNLAYAPIQSVAWNEAVRTMRQFEATEYLYLYVVTNRGVLLPVHALPDPAANSAPSRGPWMERILAPLEADLFLESARGRSGVSGLSPFMELAARMAIFPGRKNLICIGCLFAKAGDWDQDASAAYLARAVELRQLSEAFREARVAVYPVGGKPASGRVGDGSGPGVGTPGARELFAGEFGALAEVTGGRAYGSGQIDQAISQAVKDGRSSYRIAYLPPPENWDGRRHKITIGAIRKDVRIQAPAWYMADRLEDVVREQRPPIPDQAITNPFGQSDIAVSASGQKMAGSALRIEIRVEAADLLLLARNGRYSGSLALQALCYTPEGRRLACTEPMIVKLDLSEQERAIALRGGLRFPVDLPAAEAGARIQVVAHDEYSGASGSTSFVLGEER